MTELSDVTAVILSSGEPTLSQAIAQVKAQSMPPVEIVLIEGVAPFHAAFNQGLSKVRTPFFVQVDSDMLLDADCFGSLRNAVEDDVGIVVGRLEDDLMGQVVGVKLFRTICFKDSALQDSISPDTDFVMAISSSGWRTIYIGRLSGKSDGVSQSLGKHSREYQPQYTFQKYLMEGSRYVHRRKPHEFLWHLESLSRSSHPSAPLAMIALCQGVFLNASRDLLRPNQAQLVAQYNSYKNFAASSAEYKIPAKKMLFLCFPILPPAQLFFLTFSLGSRLRAAGSFPRFETLFRSLWEHRKKSTWLAVVGLAHGISFDQTNQDNTAAEWRKVEILFGDILSTRFFVQSLLHKSIRSVSRLPATLSPRSLSSINWPALRQRLQLRSLVDSFSESLFYAALYNRFSSSRLPLNDPRKRPAQGAKHIAYFLWKFPIVSETFVRRELEGLEECGVLLSVFAKLRAEIHADDPSSQKWMLKTLYLEPYDRYYFFRSLAGFLFRSPVRTIYLAFYVLTHRYGATKTLYEDLVVFAMSVYLAGRLKEYDIDHLHAPWANQEAFVALIAARLVSIPYTVQARAHELNIPRYMVGLKEILGNADFIVTNTRFNRDRIKPYLPQLDPPEVHVIYNRIDLDRFLPTDKEPSANRAVRLLAVGRLIEAKGFYYLLQVCHLLRNSRIPFTCRIIGGIQKSEDFATYIHLQMTHRQLDLGEQVLFEGEKSFPLVLEAYNWADIFVLPCVRAVSGAQDITPNAVLEAMAMRLPVVSTRQTALPELVDHGNTGFLVEPKDPQALYDALKCLIDDEELRKRMGTAGREKIAADFDMRRNSQQLASLF